VKTLFIVNARSGRKRKYDVASLIAATERGVHEIAPCGRKEDLDDLIDRAEREGFDVVCAVGGDGTVHEVARRLAHRPLALGILPIGSGNGFARHLGLPMDPRACLGACNQRRIVTIDTAAVNGIPFLGTMGVGFDALIAHRFAASHVRGLATYVRAGARAFFGYAPEDYDIALDGQPLRRRAFVVAVANSSQYGNNARIAPRASVTDGLLDVVLVDDLSLPAAALLMIRLLRGTIEGSSRVTIRQARHIELRRAAPGPAHLDGEPFTLPETLTIEVRPASLRVLVPDGWGGN
jgi:YegS/Rv2252/BmrU family lipid kinase